MSFVERLPGDGGGGAAPGDMSNEAVALASSIVERLSATAGPHRRRIPAAVQSTESVGKASPAELQSSQSSWPTQGSLPPLPQPLASTPPTPAPTQKSLRPTPQPAPSPTELSQSPPHPSEPPMEAMRRSQPGEAQPSSHTQAVGTGSSTSFRMGLADLANDDDAFE